MQFFITFNSYNCILFLRAIREYDILNKNVQQLILYTVVRVKVQGGGGGG